MTRFHFAGINSQIIAEGLEELPVLITFADVIERPGVWERELRPRLEAGLFPNAILDSGAFSEFTRPGFHVELEDYVAFCVEFGHLFDQIVTLDDIGGDLARTWRNTAALLEAGVDVVPVFHGREPFEVLEHYVERFGRVGLGFARDGRTISKNQGHGLDPNAWLERALDVCEAAGVEVHGFGMTRYARDLGHGRLTTTDSTTWNAEFKALRSRNVEAAHTIGGGDAYVLLGGLQDYELQRLAALSYAGTGADDAVEELVAECRGQARTCLRRFNVAELLAALDAIAERFAIVLDDDPEPAPAAAAEACPACGSLEGVHVADAWTDGRFTLAACCEVAHDEALLELDDLARNAY